MGLIFAWQNTLQSKQPPAIKSARVRTHVMSAGVTPCWMWRPVGKHRCWSDSEAHHWFCQFWLLQVLAADIKHIHMMIWCQHDVVQSVQQISPGTRQPYWTASWCCGVLSFPSEVVNLKRWRWAVCCLLSVCCHSKPLLAETTTQATADVGRGEAGEHLQEAVCNLKVTLITKGCGVRGETKEGRKTKGEEKVVNCWQRGRGSAGGVHYLQIVSLKKKQNKTWWNLNYKFQIIIQKHSFKWNFLIWFPLFDQKTKW